MAELLIKAVDAKHSDPAIDLAGCYKRGDVIVIMPDGHKWGRCECLPKFVVLKVPDMSVADARQYLNAYIEPEIEEIIVSKKEYDQNIYMHSFVDIPEQVETFIEEESITVKKADVEQQKKIFDIEPKNCKAKKGTVTLTGAITKVKLQGTIEDIRVRRACKISIENIKFKESIAEIKDIAPFIKYKTKNKKWQLKSSK